MNKLLKYTNADGKSMLINGTVLRTGTSRSSLDTLNFFVNCNQPTAQEFYDYFNANTVTTIQGMPVTSDAFLTAPDVNLYFFDPLGRPFKELTVIKGSANGNDFMPSDMRAVDGTTPYIKINAGSFAGKLIRWNAKTSTWYTVTKLLNMTSHDVAKDITFNISYDAKTGVEDTSIMKSGNKVGSFGWEKDKVVTFSVIPENIFSTKSGAFVTMRTNTTNIKMISKDALKINSSYLSAGSYNFTVDLTLFKNNSEYYEFTIWNVGQSTIGEITQRFVNNLPTKLVDSDAYLYFAEAIESKIKKYPCIKFIHFPDHTWTAY